MFMSTYPGMRSGLDELLCLYLDDKLFKGLADRVVRDTALAVDTFQFTVSEENCCSGETFLICTLSLAGTVSCVCSALAPSPCLS